VSSGVTAAAWAEEQIAAVRDDPAARIALVERCYHGPFGNAPRHLPYRRAAMFMRWQLRRGVLEPAHGDRPGSPWWRAVNERLLRDGREAVALSGDLPGPGSSSTVDYWMSFADYPTELKVARRRVVLTWPGERKDGLVLFHSDLSGACR
jgi:hypothetical protein